MARQQISVESADLWRRRWDSFLFMWDQTDLRWQRLYDYYDQRKRAQYPELEQQLSITTLKHLLDRLLEFSKQHFSFFYNGLIGNPLYSFDTLQDLDETPFAWLQAEYSVGEYILTTIINLATYDLMAIDQAIDQRFMAVTTVDWSATDSSQSRLRRDLSVHQTITFADELAIGAILMFNHSFEFQRYATAITYQRTSADVRVIPYAPVALIGLPISILGAREDMLAIPHEVGHFLYWNGQKSQGDTVNTFRTLLAKSLEEHLGKDFVDHPWLEEIVADVVSCLIGGPLTAYSIQQLMQTVAGAEFLDDNHTHPIPLIRPYIYTHVLAHKMGLPIATKLQEAWDAILGAQGRNIQPEQKIGDLTVKKLLESLLQPTGNLYKLVSIIADMIEIDQGQTQLAWYNVADLDTINNLIPHFKQQVESNEPNSLLGHIRQNMASNDKYVNPSLLLQESEVARFWISQIKLLFKPTTPVWLDETTLQPYLSILSTENTRGTTEPYCISALEWLTTFDAGGWTSEGGGPTNLKTIL